MEGLIKNLITGQPSQGVFSDEAGRFLGGHSMSDEKRLATMAGFSKLWDGREIDRIRAGDGATKLYGRRVSMHLMGPAGSNVPVDCRSPCRRSGVPQPLSGRGCRRARSARGAYQEIDLDQSAAMRLVP